MKQQSLFGNTNPSKHPHNSLFIFKDGKSVKMTPNQIFDSNKYTELRAITFSASGGFITKHLAKFKKIYILEGLPESSQLRSSYQNMNKVMKNAINKISDSFFNNNLVKFLDELNNPMREKIIRHDFDLRVPTTGVIHDKIYLLCNPKTHATRLISGSANMSFPAMNSRNGQHEDLFIFDNNDQMYNITFNKCYLPLFKQTDTYLGSRARQVTKKQVKKIDKKHPQQQAVITKRESDQIRKDQAVKAFTDIFRNVFARVRNPRATLVLSKYY